MKSRSIVLQPLCLALLISVSTLWAKDRFLLESELFTNYSSGSGVKVFTSYTYNDSGYRVDKSAFNGADSNAARMSRTVYTYNADHTLAEEVLKTAAGDTVSIVLHGYDANKHEIAVSTLTKAMVLRYVDSSAYNAGGQLTGKKRYSGGALSFYHDYSYDASGKMTADTLYEQPSGSFIATQAVLFAYDASGKVANEKNYRFQSGSWYLINTNKMAYAASGTLASVTQYEGDGSSNTMQDSLAYGCDAFGNRIKESHYDQNRALLSTTDYIWLDTMPPVAVVSNRGNVEKFKARFENGKVVLTNVSGRADISVFNAAGRLVQQCRREGAGNCEFALSGNISRGAYFAAIKNGNQLSTVHFTILN